jgi:hypothetical protein
MKDNVATQKYVSGEIEPAHQSHNKMLEECINYVKEHPVEVAAGTALALGSIALLKGKGIQSAAQKIGLDATVKSAEAGLVTKAAQLSDEGAKTIASGMGKANYGWSNTLRENITLPHGINTVEELQGLGKATFKTAAGPLDKGARIVQPSSASVKQNPWSENLRTQLTGEADQGLKTSLPRQGGEEVFSAFDQTNYKHVPPNLSTTNIRLSDGATIQPTDGPSRIVFGDDNSVKRLLVSKSATAAEIQEQNLVAGYAGLIKDDVLAYEAANKFTGRSIGFISQPIERMASPEQMRETAIKGATAYIKGDKAGANRYTNFLTERFGPWNPGEQSLMNSIMGPQTDIVRQASKIGTAPVPGKPPWMGNSAVRGISDYLSPS